MNKLITFLFTTLLMLPLANASMSSSDYHYFAKQKNNILEASHKTGVSSRLITAIAYNESGLGRNKYNRYSKTQGVMQFTRQTWRSSLKTAHKQLGLSPNTSVMNDRANILVASADIATNKNILRQALGRVPTDGDLYMTHLIGLGGALKVLKGKPNAPISRYVKLYAGNNTLTHKHGRPLTVSQFRTRLNNLMENTSAPFEVALNQANLDRVMMQLANNES